MHAVLPTSGMVKIITLTVNLIGRTGSEKVCVQSGGLDQ